MKQGPLLCSDHLPDLPPPMWWLVAEADQQPSLAPPAPKKWLSQVPDPGQLCQVVCGYKSIPWFQSCTFNNTV